MPNLQLSRGFTFGDGTQGNTSSMLHQLVDNGTILPGVITQQSLATPLTTDTLLFYQGTSGSLKQATVTGILGNVPTSAAANIASLRKLGTASNMAAAGNDRRFPAQISGVRVGNGTAADTVANATDLNLPCQLLNGTTVINWQFRNVFYDTLTADKTYTFLNVTSARNIMVVLKTQGHNVTWPALLGAAPVLTGGATNLYYVTFQNTPMGTSGWIEKAL